MNLIKLNFLKRQSISIAIVALIVVLDVFFILKPQFKDLSSLNSQIKSLKTKLDQIKYDLSNFKNLEKTYKDLKDKMEIFQKKIILEEEISQFIEEITHRAKLLNIKIMQIKPLSQEKKSLFEVSGSKYFPFFISVDLKSPYHALGRFINNLERSERFVKIERLEITPQQDNPSNHQVRLMLGTFIEK